MSAVLSGPMFEPAKTEYWESAFKKQGAHYNIFGLARNGRVDDSIGMDGLRQMFPEGEANEMNFCLFSTSGIHGTYTTIQEAEKPEPPEDGEEAFAPSVTFLIVHPRIVCLRYGNCEPKTPEDFAFLKKLRASSWRAVRTIGK